MREKMSKESPPAPTANTIGPCPTVIQISRTPRHWKFTQHLCTTRPPLDCLYVRIFDRLADRIGQTDILLYPRPQTLTYTR